MITQNLLLNTIEYLWNIIDDIDTASDMAKGDDDAYRRFVQELQGKRWNTGITTDGYTLNYGNLKSVKRG